MGSFDQGMMVLQIINEQWGKREDKGKSLERYINKIKGKRGKGKGEEKKGRVWKEKKGVSTHTWPPPSDVHP
jgi:hypothetical protein